MIHAIHSLGVFSVFGGENKVFGAVQCGGRTALHLAAQKGNKNIIQLLLKAKANPLNVDLAGNTALNFAILGDYTNLVPLLQCEQKVLEREVLINKTKLDDIHTKRRVEQAMVMLE